MPAFHKETTRINYKPNEALYALLIDKLTFASKFDEVETLLGNVGKDVWKCCK